MDKEQRLQIDKFKDAARDLECDDNEQRFKERLGSLVRAKPVDKAESGDSHESAAQKSQK